MKDNIIIENIEYTDELYQKAINENDFTNSEIDRVGDEVDANK